MCVCVCTCVCVCVCVCVYMCMYVCVCVWVKLLPMLAKSGSSQPRSSSNIGNSETVYKNAVKVLYTRTQTHHSLTLSPSLVLFLDLDDALGIPLRGRGLNIGL